MVEMPATETTPVGTENVVFSNSQVTSDTYTGDPNWLYSQFSPLSVSISTSPLGYQGNDTLTIAATLTWTQNSIYDTSNPPATVTYAESSNAYADTYAGLNISTSEACDGLGDSPYTYFAGTNSRGMITTQVTVPHDNNGKLMRAFTLQPRTLTNSIAVVYSDNFPHPTPACFFGVSYNVIIDARVVEIQASYGKCSGPVAGGYTGAVVTNRKSAFTNPDGSLMTNGYGDILYGLYPNYFDGINSSSGDISTDDSFTSQPNRDQINYTAALEGATPPFSFDGDSTLSYTWFHNLSNGVDPDHIGPKGFTSLDPSIDMFQVNYNGDFDPGGIDDPAPPVPTGTTTLGIDHVYFTYTPVAGGTEYTSNYYMHVHQAREWYKSNKSPDLAWRPVTSLKVADPGTAGNNGTISATWNDDNPLSAPVTFDGTQITAGFFTVIGASTPNPLLNGMLTLAGFAVDKYGPVPDSGTADFDGCWDSPYSTFSSGMPADYYNLDPIDQNAERDDYSMTPYMFMAYWRNYYTYDVWNNHGYYGQYFAALDTLILTPAGAPASNPWCGAFQKIQDIGTSTPPVPARPVIDAPITPEPPDPVLPTPPVLTASSI